MLALKILLRDFDYSGKAEDIFSKLSEKVTLKSVLEKQELFGWFAKNNLGMRRSLRIFEAKILEDSDPMVEAQGFVGLLLGVVGTPDVNFIELENSGPLIDSLVAGKVLTDGQAASLKVALERSTNRAEQDFGFLPTLDQIYAALETEWPTSAAELMQ
jgi:hypothetical protein